MQFATGAMSSLLPKLGALLFEEYNLQKDLKKGVKNLMDELVVIQAVLEKVSDVPLDQLDPLVKIWANDVRELSYAIEDNLDSFMLGVQDLEPSKPHTFFGFIKKTCKTVCKLKIRREIASDIKDIKIQVKEVKQRYDRYKHAISHTSATTKVDSRLLALYNKVSNLFGIDEAVNELTKRMSKSDNVSQKDAKTISIVGFGGLGKTTLVKVIYDNLKKTFDCGGFVSVGRNPDLKKVLRDILHELDKEKYKCITESKMDEKQLIDVLQEFLADKRYLIIIDDIWDISTWEIIKCALAESSSGSRIITTTRICDVAKTIGGVYNMQPLSDGNSKRLFYSRIFGGEGTNSHDQSDEMSNQIFKKCGGVPLSIITLASLLVSKPRDDWCAVINSIGFGHEDNEAVQNTRKILSFSYYDLPFHLKTCLLYLSVYHEDVWIYKNSVIWKWVAEGFIPIRHGIGAFEVGQSYYNDLINRNMIQPRIVGMEEGCHIHDIILDLIRCWSNEINFVRIQEIVHYNTCSPSTSSRARRLAIHGGTIGHKDMGPVRSINALRCVGGFLPRHLSFEVLRVLSLENCYFSEGGCRLEHLGKLVQLRYLGLMGTRVTELPTDIGHDLKFLQTLDVEKTGIKELPPLVGELTKLMCLIASEGTTMTAKIGKLTCLEELELHHVDKSPDFTVELEKLTQLRLLKIFYDEINESMSKALVTSARNLHKIQTLKIWSESDEQVYVDGWEEWNPPSHLRQLSLAGMILPRRPSWLDSSCVPHLSYLHFTVRLLKMLDLQILGSLSLLRNLHLYSGNAISYTVGSHEFQSLTCLNTNSEIVCGEGALPLLEELGCGASAGTDVGLVRNMPLLQKITYGINCYDLCLEEVEAAEAALRQTAETHPNRPLLKTERHFYESDEERSKDESARRAVAVWDMIVDLGRTVVVLTMGQSNVCAEDLQDYLSDMFPSVLNNPVIHDLLFKLGSQSGLDYPLGVWRHYTKGCAEKYRNRPLDDILSYIGKCDSSVDNLSEMMKLMIPVVSQVLAGLSPFESSLQRDEEDHISKGMPTADEEQEEESDQESDWRAAAVWDMLVELGRTVVVLTRGQSIVHAEDQKDYLSSMASSVLNNPVIHGVLFNLGSKSGLEYPLVFWRSLTERCSEQWMNAVLDAVQDVHGPGQSDSSDNLSEMMQQMMPVVSQVLAELPPFESKLEPEHNNDGRLRDELDISLQPENGGPAKIVARNNEEACLP